MPCNLASSVAFFCSPSFFLSSEDTLLFPFIDDLLELVFDDLRELDLGVWDVVESVTVWFGNSVDVLEANPNFLFAADFFELVEVVDFLELDFSERFFLSSTFLWLLIAAICSLDIPCNLASSAAFFWSPSFFLSSEDTLLFPIFDDLRELVFDDLLDVDLGVWDVVELASVNPWLGISVEVGEFKPIFLFSFLFLEEVERVEVVDFLELDFSDLFFLSSIFLWLLVAAICSFVIPWNFASSVAFFCSPIFFLSSEDTLFIPLLDDLLVWDIADLLEEVLDNLLGKDFADLLDEVLDNVLVRVFADLLEEVLDNLLGRVLADLLEEVLDNLLGRVFVDLVAEVLDDLLERVFDVLDEDFEELDFFSSFFFFFFLSLSFDVAVEDPPTIELKPNSDKIEKYLES